MIPRRDGILIFFKKEGYDGPELGLGILISDIQRYIKYKYQWVTIYR